MTIGSLHSDLPLTYTEMTRQLCQRVGVPSTFNKGRKQIYTIGSGAPLQGKPQTSTMPTFASSLNEDSSVFED